jgi:predicted nucleic acid-binding protein
LLSELGRVLTEKFAWEAGYVEEVLAQLVRVAVVVDPTEQVADITDDPPDNRVLEAAAEGQATVIISGPRPR